MINDIIISTFKKLQINLKRIQLNHEIILAKKSKDFEKWYQLI